MILAPNSPASLTRWDSLFEAYNEVTPLSVYGDEDEDDLEEILDDEDDIDDDIEYED